MYRPINRTPTARAQGCSRTGVTVSEAWNAATVPSRSFAVAQRAPAAFCFFTFRARTAASFICADFQWDFASFASFLNVPLSAFAPDGFIVFRNLMAFVAFLNLRSAASAASSASPSSPASAKALEASCKSLSAFSWISSMAFASAWAPSAAKARTARMEPCSLFHLLCAAACCATASEFSCEACSHTSASSAPCSFAWSSASSAFAMVPLR
mmetsp:Transcript_61441/g.101576  ORF Transcript_61441/g.101576 Transcript_61441/m.101576 type:complete len:212 (-) Transcript_61441:2870-3505(-)